MYKVYRNENFFLLSGVISNFMYVYSESYDFSETTQKAVTFGWVRLDSWNVHRSFCIPVAVRTTNTY